MTTPPDGVIRLLRGHQAVTRRLACVVALGVFLVTVGVSLDSERCREICSVLAGPRAVAIFGAALVHFLAFGLTLRWSYRHVHSVVLARLDAVALPFMMYLFTYIIPLKGGMIFQSFYMRRRYGVDLSKGVSTSLAIFACGLALSVVGALVLSAKASSSSGLILVAMLTVGSIAAVTLLIWDGPLRVVRESKLQTVAKVAGFFTETRDGLLRQLTQPKLVGPVLFLVSCSIAVESVWYWKTAYALGHRLNLASVIPSVLVLRTLLLVRLVPGNLGVQELVTTMVLRASGLPVEAGVEIALCMRITSLLLAIPIGGLALRYLAGSRQSFGAGFRTPQRAGECGGGNPGVDNPAGNDDCSSVSHLRDESEDANR